MRPHLETLSVVLILLLVVGTAVAQQGKGSECTPAGTWYGGSVVAYQMTIFPAGPAGRYIGYAEGMFHDSVLHTSYTGVYEKRGEKYVGSIMRLATTDPDFLNAPPVGKMPDIYAGWTSMEMVDCNTIRNVIPFFGIYYAKNIWQPGVVWVAGGKRPMIDPPDVDLLKTLNGGHDIVEIYHRLPEDVNSQLLHKP